MEKNHNSDDLVHPSRASLQEALDLSGDILRNIELSELPLVNIALKTSRLARILGDFDVQKIMAYEAGGYPSESTGVAQEVWRLAVVAGRKFSQSDLTKIARDHIYTEGIAVLEHSVRISEMTLSAAKDPNVSVTSANPNQTVFNPVGNTYERNLAKQDALQASRRLASRRTLIHEYVLRKHYELKLSGIADDIFSRVRARVDAAIGGLIPDAVQKFSSIHENLKSDNTKEITKQLNNPMSKRTND
ncbi:MAG: hypothetical protein ACKVQC_07930 [Elusimicrobiota bacterium]